jgi:hypothetical protein
MKKDVAEKWVAALRSGNYKQGTGRLRNNDKSFCCLGVLCDVLGRKFDEYGVVEETSVLLPKSVVEEAKMKNDAGVIEEDPKGLALWEQNDIANKSFNEIADFIEQNWKDL